MEEKRTSSGAVPFLFGLFLLVAVVAALLYRDRSSMEWRLKKTEQALRETRSGGAGGEEPGDTNARPPARVYDLLNVVAQKEATIADLRQQIRDLRAGKVPEIRPLPAPRPKPVKPPPKRIEPESPPAVSPPRAPAVALPDEPVVGTFGEQLDFLQKFDTTGWPALARNQHAELVRQLQGIRAALDRAAGSSAGVAATFRRAAMDQVRALGERFDNEQSQLLRQTGRELGYDEDGARRFAETIDNLMEMTDYGDTMRRIVAYEGEAAADAGSRAADNGEDAAH